MDTASPRRRTPRPLESTPSFRVLTALGLALAAASGGATYAQESDSRPTTGEREWAYPSRGPSRAEARAANANRPGWDPYSWYASVSAGPAWFNGDGLSDSADFAAEGRLAHDLTDEVYLVGAYTFALTETEGDDGLGGSTDEDTVDLHIFSFGVGFRLEATPEVHFFIEPRAGVLFGSDADAAPVGLLSGGVELAVTEGIAVRFAVTGLITDSDINTEGPDANLDSGVMGTLGIAFEF
jgi:hypothetical protein